MHSWYIATSEASRARARAFTLAFGARDLMWPFTFTMSVLYHYGYVARTPEGLLDESSPLVYIVPFFYELAVIIYVPLVAYGILRVQLFDVDLRIKRTIRRSTVAALFVATFFVVSELAGNFLSGKLGVVVTGGLAFFLDRIQRAAEGFADAAMPNTHYTPEHENYRKLQEYENALQAALKGGHISERQRRVLNSIVESMGIDSGVAERLENDARGAMAA